MLTVGLVWLAAAWAQEPEPVVFAAERVPPGTIVQRGQVYTARMHPAHRPPNTASDTQEVVGRLALEPLLPSMPVRLERLGARGSGLGALVAEGAQLVRVPVLDAVPWPRAGEHVDVLRVHDGQGCVVAVGARVIAGETSDGALWTDHRNGAPFVALHLAVAGAEAGPLASVAPAEVVLLGRDPADAAQLPPPLARCGEPRPAVVAHRDEQPRRRHERGAQVIELLRGENAFVGELRLPGGARIPPHRDPTEEYLVVLEGQGIVTIDGTAHPIGPGSVVYMPARAKVSFVNGAGTLVAYQVFAGPAPADKYADWREISRAVDSRPAPASP